jgi:ABC-2 type transport system ATP-binding protein
MEEIIKTENLSKNYGKLTAVNSVELTIRQGEIYGFLGLNGAGKTTTIRMLLGMIRPSGGTVYLFGKKADPGDGQLWNRVGHLVETPTAYPELTVLENLEIFYRLRFLKDRKLLDEIIEKLYLGAYLNTRARNLSLGNAQRLGIAKALMHHPQLLILDEPSNALDPAGIVQVRELLTELAHEHGVTIFISSHILGEISRFATRIGIIHEGCMIREAEPENLEQTRHRALYVNTLNNQEAIPSVTAAGYQVQINGDGILEISGKEALEHPEKISELLVFHGFPPTSLSLHEEELEHYFLRIIHRDNKI